MRLIGVSMEKNLAVLFQNRAFRLRHRPFLFFRKGTEGWKSVSWNEAARRADRIGRALIRAGISVGDRVAIRSHSCPEWALADLAIVSIGAVTVPVSPDLSPEQTEFVLRHSRAKLLVTDDFPDTAGLAERVPELSEIVRTGSGPPLPKCTGFPDFERRGAELPPAAFYDRMENVTGSDVATVIYTFRTREPRGVMLTHSNLLSNAAATAAGFGLSEADRVLSFLPLSHLVTRTAGFFAGLTAGAETAFAENPKEIFRDLAGIRPTVLLGTPPFLEELRGRIQGEASKGARLKRLLFDRGVAAGRGFAHTLSEALFFRRIRNGLGGRIRCVVSSGSALSSDLWKFFRSLGVEVLDVYSLSEAGSVVTANLPGRNRPGTVGRPLPGIELRLAPDGEILVRGPGVMKGYLADESATSAALSEEAFLHTGDLGAFDPDGFLRLAGRKNNNFQ